jgi:transcriptional regulator with XRE-family HTH domain
MPRPQPTIGEQLAALLADTGLSQRELARRIALEEGRDGDDFKKACGRLAPLAPEGAAARLAKGGVRNPTRKRLDLVERAAGRDGYFTIPVRPPRAAEEEWRARIERRLQEVEEQATRDVAKLRRDLNRAIRRIHALEQRAPGEALPERPSEARP